MTWDKEKKGFSVYYLKRMPWVILADLLGKKVEKKKEKEVLMDYQKTRNYREKEKIEKRAQRKKGS